MSAKTRAAKAAAIATAQALVADPEGVDETSETSTPEAPATTKQTPAERKTAREAKEDTIRAEGGVVRNAAGRPTARRLPCLCGCGQPTHTDEAWFLSGHDAKLRKAIVDGKLGIEQVPEIVRPFFRLGSPIAGLLLEEDGSFSDTKAAR